MKQSFFAIGSLKFNYYGLLVSFGLILTYFSILTFNRKLRVINEKTLEKMFLFVLPFVLVGARLYHVLDNLTFYISSPLEIFAIQKGGLGIFGALFGFLAGVCIFCKINKISIINVLNLLSPSILIAQSIGRLGNYFNNEAVGPETKFILGIIINGKKYHPVFLYESILCLIFYVIYLFLPNKIKAKYGLSYYLISYGIIRLITETFRNDTWKVSSIKIADIFSVIFIALGLFLIKNVLNSGGIAASSSDTTSESSSQ